MHYVHNATGQPEAVLNPDQLKWLKSVADGAAGRSGPSVQIGEVHGLNPDQIADRILSRLAQR